MPPSVSVVITTYNHAHFLRDALGSVSAQACPADEVIVVDDGSTDRPEDVTAEWPAARLIRQSNRGLAAARNAGLRAAESEYVLFLDADDLLTPVAIEAALACSAQHPDAALVYGAHQRVDVHAVPSGQKKYTAISGDPFAAMLRGNLIGMHATVLYRRALLAAAGGFDEHLRRCEDYDVYLRLTRQHPIASHPAETALYRWHGANMSADANVMLETLLRVHRRHRPGASEGAERINAWQEGRRNFRDYYVSEVIDNARAAGRPRAVQAREAARTSMTSSLRMIAAMARRAVARRLSVPVAAVLRLRGVGHPQRIHRVPLGDQEGADPVSRDCRPGADGSSAATTSSNS